VAAVTDPRVNGVELLAPPDRQKQEAITEGAGEVIQEPAKLAEGPLGAEVSTDPAPAPASVTDAMRQKLRSPEGHAVYKMRKAVVEPVFGQIKERRGFRRFLLRGLKKVEAEWQIICLTHNLMDQDALHRKVVHNPFYEAALCAFRKISLRHTPKRHILPRPAKSALARGGEQRCQRNQKSLGRREMPHQQERHVAGRKPVVRRHAVSPGQAQRAGDGSERQQTRQMRAPIGVAQIEDQKTTDSR
jgi:hypothetical protein